MQFDAVVEFHGHACPGLALGYRVAQLALQELGKRATDEELIAIVENNSCAVDAIQVMLGCTFGKGNLFFKDHGKQVYTIMKRDSKESLRISVTWRGGPETPTEKQAWQQYNAGDRTPEVLDLVHSRKTKKMQAILQAQNSELFTVVRRSAEPPQTARVYPSVRCELCGEKVMAPRTVPQNSQRLCIPCAEKTGLTS